ncbi:MAG: NADH-quinone oxidoreductase subunit M [Chloroflexi bacterium]|nr:NADH-quinone oxidoreductase subunit M [Chloroflexota bacterium]
MEFADFYPLSLIIFLPAVGALLIAVIPGLDSGGVKRIAAFFTFCSFALSLAMFCLFDRSSSAYQFVESVSWIPQININYHIGVDGLSMPLVILTTLLGFLSVFVSWRIELRPKEYFAWLLILESSILGVFCSLDLLLFFLFWEVEVIPMYFLISIWGGGRRAYSAIKYVIYTMFGGAMMLAGILTLYATTGTFDMTVLAGTDFADLVAVIPLAAIFWLLITAFLIKLPVFPLHTWLPDAHTDAPTAVSVMLAGSLLKMGGYGMIRICVTVFPDVARDYAHLLVILAVIGILYGAAVTIKQTDLKRLIAYSSVSHMGYVLLGVFALSDLSITGACLQMFSHGMVTGLLFAMVGLVYDKTHTRSIPELGGLARQMPIIVAVFSVAGLASLGLPGTSGFAAEFIVFLGSFTSTAVAGIKIYTLLGALAIVVTAGYILWMLERVFYREPKPKYDGVPDANKLEMAYIFTFVAVIMLVGIYPRILTDVIDSWLPTMPLP